MNRYKALLLVLLWIPASLASAETLGPSIHYLDDDGKLVRGMRCATSSPSREMMEAVEALTPKTTDKVAEKNPTIIPVAVHVIHGPDGLGDMPNSRIEEQIQVLDDAFAATNFSFVLDQIDRTERLDWFEDCADGATEAAIRASLAVSPATVLNLYTCDPAGLLGRATFPWQYPETDTRHGIVVKHSTLPGGGAIPYDEGDTAVHEAGHYLGLYHTFHNGCSALSDYVVDTPHEASAASGCPVGRDTCRKGGGVDPIHNYMDYSDDLCLTEFTPGQAVRMQNMVAAWRPSL